ncbi:hypothetical protein GGQ92_002986 [Gracilibacillus halotolerans]|uniref:DUF454 domain-containing protein n=1 Tax=Gracilibacillus halotolerans TaxID=74386 RepID=A0A841RSJ0_9BACI|nr:YbaN family protein [Gracilibacillus halotolerans]MBB6514165.1 hypothetical protein [Gracilibacillus halotolerans]
MNQLSNWRRILWVSSGTVSLAIGAIGIVVPILPTTPLIILAAFCFGKGSPALHQLLISNRYFGHYIKDYQEGKGVPLHIKFTAVFLVWTSVLFSLLVIPLLAVKLFMTALAIFLSIFIFTSPLLKEK